VMQRINFLVLSAVYVESNKSASILMFGQSEIGSGLRGVCFLLDNVLCCK